MAVRGLGCPVRFTLTAGQRGDAPQAATLIEGLGMAGFDSYPEIWKRYFVDRMSYELLLSGDDGAVAFWRRRAEAIAGELNARTAV